MLNAGLSWTEIWRMIKEEKRAGNPLANFIHKCDFEKQTVTVLLEPDDDEDMSISEVMTVELDLRMSAQMNIQKYFQIKKKSAVKEEKTRQKAEQAIQMAEVNAKKQIEKVKTQNK